jgi:uncharacterized protein YijF (DUF1287 family)
MAANLCLPEEMNWLLRVPTRTSTTAASNLMVFFQRHGEVLPTTTTPSDYHPGDLVTWDLGGGVPHIGTVVDQKWPSGRYVIVHNIGQGPIWTTSSLSIGLRTLPVLRHFRQRTGGGVRFVSGLRGPQRG